MHNLYDLVSFVFMVIAFLPSFYLAYHVRTTRHRWLFRLPLLISIFTSVHGAFHLARFLHSWVIADGVLLPAGVFTLAVFSLLVSLIYKTF